MLHVPTSFNPAGVDDLVRRWQTDHDERARDKLVRRYLPIIKAIAHRWGDHWEVDRDDAVGEAFLAFLRALETYDPHAAPLSAYFNLWVKARIGRARQASLPMFVPLGAFNDTSKVARAAFKLRRRLGRHARLEEVAAETRLGIGRAESAIAANKMRSRMMSMSTPLGEDGDSTFRDSLPADEGDRPDVVVENHLTVTAARDAINEVLGRFVPRHRELFRLRFVEERTLEECGIALGVNRQRAQQIETKIVARLREALVDHPAALALLGREPATIATDDDGFGALIGIVEVEERTGLDRKAIAEMLGRGAFPRSAARDNRRARLWRESAVERWVTLGAGGPRDIRSLNNVLTLDGSAS